MKSTLFSIILCFICIGINSCVVGCLFNTLDYIDKKKHKDQFWNPIHVKYNSKKYSKKEINYFLDIYSKFKVEDSIIEIINSAIRYNNLLLFQYYYRDSNYLFKNFSYFKITIANDSNFSKIEFITKDSITMYYVVNTFERKIKEVYVPFFEKSKLRIDKNYNAKNGKTSLQGYKRIFEEEIIAKLNRFRQ